MLYFESNVHMCIVYLYSFLCVHRCVHMNVTKTDVSCSFFRVELLKKKFKKSSKVHVWTTCIVYLYLLVQFGQIKKRGEIPFLHGCWWLLYLCFFICLFDVLFLILFFNFEKVQVPEYRYEKYFSFVRKDANTANSVKVYSRLDPRQPFEQWSSPLPEWQRCILLIHENHCWLYTMFPLPLVLGILCNKTCWTAH